MRLTWIHCEAIHQPSSSQRSPFQGAVRCLTTIQNGYISAVRAKAWRLGAPKRLAAKPWGLAPIQRAKACSGCDLGHRTWLRRAVQRLGAEGAQPTRTKARPQPFESLLGAYRLDRLALEPTVQQTRPLPVLQPAALLLRNQFWRLRFPSNGIPKHGLTASFILVNPHSGYPTRSGRAPWAALGALAL